MKQFVDFFGFDPVEEFFKAAGELIGVDSTLKKTTFIYEFELSSEDPILEVIDKLAVLLRKAKEEGKLTTAGNREYALLWCDEGDYKKWWDFVDLIYKEKDYRLILGVEILKTNYNEFLVSKIIVEARSKNAFYGIIVEGESKLVLRVGLLNKNIAFEAIEDSDYTMVQPVRCKLIKILKELNPGVFE